ncbi:MAG: nitroreductase family deazaflavin-dependent oxidoreductase [Dehalococcoidia bacterium]|nr:nitroreductase family deazaflavin-dependent oxidoreductase [Dehalococcoidia bacterium]
MANDFNRKIIDEFRANDGRVGGSFSCAHLVLLTTTGACSGRAHTTPLVPLEDGGNIYVFASMGGAPRHPAWYFNLLAHPQVTVERGKERFEATAEVVHGDERDRLYARQSKLMPNFAEYQKNTARRIPVIALRRRA